jgi:hypothetical protein
MRVRDAALPIVADRMSMDGLAAVEPSVRVILTGVRRPGEIRATPSGELTFLARFEPES